MYRLFLLTSILFLLSCNKQDATFDELITIDQDAVLATFDGRIDLNNLPNYANQDIPNYINKDNTQTNVITNGGAVLGRVLFYDKNLSTDKTISCSSCHRQSLAFGDDALASLGVNGTTGRHSMRLVNSRFADEENFFWDERAASLESQTTQPIRDHIEMGFSGDDGNEDFNALITRLKAIEYYNELFTYVYGDTDITEQRMQNALAQFIRSIQSFDSKFDVGRSTATNNNVNFSNFTTEENQGKTLFLQRPTFNNNGVRVDGGLGCNGCHRAPEFDIDPRSDNNGVTSSIDSDTDLAVTRAPSLRDIFNANGTLNGPLMHTGDFDTFEEVMDHYNSIPANNANLDNRLAPRGNVQQLNMTTEEKEAVVAFIKTLSGSDIYTNEKWSDPFED
ncbi:MAG: cytochrome c peroxidase [Bacteroidota bacterium]